MLRLEETLRRHGLILSKPYNLEFGDGEVAGIVEGAAVGVAFTMNEMTVGVSSGNLPNIRESSSTAPSVKSGSPTSTQSLTSGLALSNASISRTQARRSVPKLLVPSGGSRVAVQFLTGSEQAQAYASGSAKTVPALPSEAQVGFLALETGWRALSVDMAGHVLVLVACGPAEGSSAPHVLVTLHTRLFEMSELAFEAPAPATAEPEADRSAEVLLVAQLDVACVRLGDGGGVALPPLRPARPAVVVARSEFLVAVAHPSGVCVWSHLGMRFRTTEVDAPPLRFRHELGPAVSYAAIERNGVLALASSRRIVLWDLVRVAELIAIEADETAPLFQCVRLCGDFLVVAAGLSLVVIDYAHAYRAAPPLWVPIADVAAFAPTRVQLLPAAAISLVSDREVIAVALLTLDVHVYALASGRMLQAVHLCDRLDSTNELVPPELLASEPMSTSPPPSPDSDPSVWRAVLGGVPCPSGRAPDLEAVRAVLEMLVRLARVSLVLHGDWLAVAFEDRDDVVVSFWPRVADALDASARGGQASRPVRIKDAALASCCLFLGTKLSVWTRKRGVSPVVTFRAVQTKVEAFRPDTPRGADAVVMHGATWIEKLQLCRRRSLALVRFLLLRRESELVSEFGSLLLDLHYVIHFVLHRWRKNPAAVCLKDPRPLYELYEGLGVVLEQLEALVASNVMKRVLVVVSLRQRVEQLTTLIYMAFLRFAQSVQIADALNSVGPEPRSWVSARVPSSGTPDLSSDDSTASVRKSTASTQGTMPEALPSLSAEASPAIPRSRELPAVQPSDRASMHELEAMLSSSSPGSTSEAVRVWSRLFGRSTAVSVDDFIAGLAADLDGAISDQDAKLVNFVADNSLTGLVTLRRFIEVLKGFGPYSGVVRNICDLLRHPGFFGFLSHSESLRLLETQPNGTYLVRFSESQPGQFTLCFVYKQSVLQTHVEFNLEHQSPVQRLMIRQGSKLKYYERVVDAIAQIKNLLVTPFQSDLVGRIWFHGDLSSGEANGLLEGSEPGTFLVRFSSRNRTSYALSFVEDSGTVAHQSVDRGSDGEYVSARRSFRSLDEIVVAYRNILREPFVNPNHLLFLVRSGTPDDDDPAIDAPEVPDGAAPAYLFPTDLRKDSAPEPEPLRKLSIAESVGSDTAYSFMPSPVVAPVPSAARPASRRPSNDSYASMPTSLGGSNTGLFSPVTRKSRLGTTGHVPTDPKDEPVVAMPSTSPAVEPALDFYLDDDDE